MGECNCRSARVWKDSWEGLDGIRFCAGGYEAFIVPQLGANLIELKDMKQNLNLLRTLPNVEAFKARPHVYGIPVLFPPNRIEAGTFKVGEATYHFPINDSSKENHIHGFLRHRPWEVTKMAADGDTAEVEVTTNADKNTEFFAHFPHEFEFKIQYILSSEGLMQKIFITNQSERAMPMGLGFHTAFNVPFHPESSGQDVRLIVSVGEKWELNEKSMPTGKLIPLDQEETQYRGEGIKPVGKPMLDHYTARAIDMNGKKFNGAILMDESKGLKLVYEVSKEYKHWMIWNDTGSQGFVCPEPQTWVVNAPNIKLPDETTGFKVLSPEETWEGISRIYIEKV
ncbi:MAG: aldose 1-epimerase [Clostridia bacterium]|nr:aldose 1-epimerase [Clostridia bacterium]